MVFRPVITSEGKRILEFLEWHAIWHNYAGMKCMQTDFKRIYYPVFLRHIKLSLITVNNTEANHS